RRPLAHDPSLIVMAEGRDVNRFDARSIGGVGIFPCAGGRDDDAAARLGAGLGQKHPRAQKRAAPGVPIPGLLSGGPPADAGDRVWYAAPGCWLERTAAA